MSAPAPAPAPLDGRRFPGWLVILGALTAIGPLSIDMYLPAFPIMERDLGSPAGGAELTLAGFFIGMAFGQLFWGPLSDRYGRKPPLYAGLALYALASLGCALVTLLIWGRYQIPLFELMNEQRCARTSSGHGDNRY